MLTVPSHVLAQHAKLLRLPLAVTVSLIAKPKA